MKGTMSDSRYHKLNEEIVMFKRSMIHTDELIHLPRLTGKLIFK